MSALTPAQRRARYRADPEHRADALRRFNAEGRARTRLVAAHREEYQRYYRDELAVALRAEMAKPATDREEVSA